MSSRGRKSSSAIKIILASLFCLTAIETNASERQSIGAPQPPTRIAKPATGRPARPPLPPPETMLALIRTHILALDHALRSNSFVVLHAISGPYLQSRLTPERLSEAFAPLKASRPDLAAVAIKTPNLVAAPAFTKNGMLWLKGTFPTSHADVSFEMVFEISSSEWRLAGLDVGAAR